jgi:Dolichyl-phosphate-mannose-protein mannosyltransferase
MGRIPADVWIMAEGRRAAIGCGILCAIFAVVCWTAAAGKSPTMDEPDHAVTGWFNLYRADFRLSPEVPALWQEFIALIMGGGAIHYDPDSPAYRGILVHRDLSAWTNLTLFHTPGVDALGIIQRGRTMSLLLGLSLAILIARWAWRLGGSIAAIAATAAYCLDPNFLGHAALVKNDVPIALAYLAASYAIWTAGRRLTWATFAAVPVFSAAALGVKFSGLLIAPVMIVLLLIRALEREPWPIFDRLVERRSQKLLAASLLCVVAVVFNIFALWAAYGFRFDAGPDGMRLDTSRFVDVLRYMQSFNIAHHPPTQQQLDAWQMPASTKLMLLAEEHHLLPQAWIDGFIRTQGGSESRLCFLAGEFYNGGKWDYFPLAAFFKSPLATILAVVLSLWIGFGAARRGLLRKSNHRWAALCLILPGAAYALIAISSNVNIGLRHFFPVYPFVFIGIGLAIDRLWHAGAGGRWMVAFLGFGLAIETAFAYPNFINFFGIACGGRSAGYSLLSDSNFDWGQDLPLLAAWQRANPDTPLYLDYFGGCDPSAYGIEYANLPDGFEFGPPPREPDRGGIVAVSATNLHLLTAYDRPPHWFGLIKGRTPISILGGSIYLFKVTR